MAETKFRYNPKTLRYERASVSVLSIVFSAFGYIVLGGLFFVGLVMLQNYFVDTPLEKTLRAENAALKEYKVVLAASLKESNERINQLKEEDTRLYEQLFETKANLPTDNSKAEKDEILTAEPELFGEWEQTTRQQTEMLFNKAKTSTPASRMTSRSSCSTSASAALFVATDSCTCRSSAWRFCTAPRHSSAWRLASR